MIQAPCAVKRSWEVASSSVPSSFSPASSAVSSTGSAEDGGEVFEAPGDEEAPWDAGPLSGGGG
jgi:hypothetical protein